MLLLPARVRDGLLYDGHLEGLHLLMFGHWRLGLLALSLGVGGDRFRCLTHLQWELDPLPGFVMAALCLQYGVTRPRRTMVEAM